MKRQNRLKQEQSPYLLQHASNPVDWFPWGHEAFARAKREKKAIFLSIGYASCHWCHVMAEECFEDIEVAALLNEAFVCVKVDREERPDIDGLYMSACQMMTGSGGWPLTIVMTPEGEPFFAATYIPKRGEGGMMGLMQLIPRLSDLWQRRRDHARRTAEIAVQALRAAEDHGPEEILTAENVTAGVTSLQEMFDGQYGGFGGAPKFPPAPQLLFLLHVWKRTGDAMARRMVEETLYQMHDGGIFDQVGFGIHRYAVDSAWRVPHFEKMLADQALFAMVAIEAFQAFGDDAYQVMAREVFTYVERELLAQEGGFLTSQDADSQGQEGKFYRWTRDELLAALAPEDLALSQDLYGIASGDGVGRGEHPSEAEGWILHRSSDVSRIAQRNGLTPDELLLRVEGIRQQLFDAREKRPTPKTDRKILTDWNALMIAAFARGGAAFGDPSYLERAACACDFLWNALRTDEGRLMHRCCNGQAALMGMLDDYAFLIFALIELAESGSCRTSLPRALALNALLTDHFWDAEVGAYFLAADDAEKLIIRQKEFADGALPSGNAIQMLNLIRLSKLTGDALSLQMARKSVTAISSAVKRSPLGLWTVLRAVDLLL